jgi:tyrosine-protein phosphatase YwqE
MLRYTLSISEEGCHDTGSLQQVFVGTLKKIRNISLQLVEANLTHFIANDAHNKYVNKEDPERIKRKKLINIF